MNLSAQKSPYHIRNFRTSEYGGFNQTWQVVQDEQGIMFLGSSSCVYTYNGIDWNQILVKRGAATRQVHYDSTSKTIFVGSVADFGYLGKDSSGFYAYRSMMDQVPEKHRVFSDIWKIQQQGDKIYFQSAERIFVVENKKIVGTIEPSQGNTFALLFNCGGKLYVRQRGVGLMEISGTKMTLVNHSEAFGSIRVMGMLPYDDNTNLILTSGQGFIKMSGLKNGAISFEDFPIASDTFLLESGVLGCEWVNENEFAVNSRNGLKIYTRDFQPKILFNKKSGLKDEAVSEFFVDREKNIWLTHNDGVSTISYSVPVLSYSDEIGFEGTPDIIEFAHDTVYLGSTAGLFRSVVPIGFGSPLHFDRMNIRNTEVWNAMHIGKSILISTSEGLAEFENNTATDITRYYTNQTMWLDSNKTLITAEKGGFSVISRNANSSWSMLRHFEIPGMELIRLSSPSAVKNKDGKYTVTGMTRFKTVVIIQFNAIDSALSVREYGPKNGLPLDDCYPLQIGDSVYYMSYMVAFRYDPAKDINDSSICFSEAPDIYFQLYSGNMAGVHPLNNYRLFLEQPKYDAYTTFFGVSDTGVFAARILLGEVFLGSNIQYGIVRNDNVAWLLNQQSLIQYNLATPIDTSLKYFSLITRVRFSGDSMGQYYPQTEITLPYKRNSVIFNFAAPYYTYDMSRLFQYQLIGFDTAWSKLTVSHEKEYTNLPEGTYTFVVRAENAFAMKSSEARYVFTILPPWYRTKLAYASYVVGFFLLLFGTVRLSAHRLLKQKEKLEELVTERTAEVVAQNQQIEAQKVDLEVAYTGIQDSIHYAQRIQQAILPTNEEVLRIVPNSFVLFKPRDIVSGDFYWLVEKNNVAFIACVDCTGHGVPGALMSMIGNTILNQLVVENKMTNPNEILNELHNGVRQALKQDAGGDTRDGMDIAFIALDKSSRRLKYAGANRSLWIIRDKKLIETKADKMSIAGDQHETSRRFIQHEIQLEQGDCIYLSTDGYADQFGGERGKKFMVKQFHNLLLEIHKMPLQEQHYALESAFVKWKDNLEQVDDVLVIGIAIP